MGAFAFGWAESKLTSSRGSEEEAEEEDIADAAAATVGAFVGTGLSRICLLLVIGSSEVGDAARVGI